LDSLNFLASQLVILVVTQAWTAEYILIKVFCKICNSVCSKRTAIATWESRRQSEKPDQYKLWWAI